MTALMCILASAQLSKSRINSLGADWTRYTMESDGDDVDVDTFGGVEVQFLRNILNKKPGPGWVFLLLPACTRGSISRIPVEKRKINR
jgi:hypothetical protein